jgi:hypothetical protein
MKPEEFVKESVIEDKNGVQWIVADIKPDGKVYCIRYDEVCDFDSDSFWAIECRLVSIPKSPVESIIINCFKPIGFKLDSTDKTDWILNREEFKIRIDEPLIDKEESIWHIYVSGDKIYEGKIKTIQYANLLIENLGL